MKTHITFICSVLAIDLFENFIFLYCYTGQTGYYCKVSHIFMDYYRKNPKRVRRFKFNISNQTEVWKTVRVLFKNQLFYILHVPLSCMFAHCVFDLHMVDLMNIVLPTLIPPEFHSHNSYHYRPAHWGCSIMFPVRPCADKTAFMRDFDVGV